MGSRLSPEVASRLEKALAFVCGCCDRGFGCLRSDFLHILEERTPHINVSDFRSVEESVFQITVSSKHWVIHFVGEEAGN